MSPVIEILEEGVTVTLDASPVPVAVASPVTEVVMGPPVVLASGVTAIVALTQAEYDAMAVPRPATTLYVII